MTDPLVPQADPNPAAAQAVGDCRSRLSGGRIHSMNPWFSTKVIFHGLRDAGRHRDRCRRRVILLDQHVHQSGTTGSIDRRVRWQ